MKKFSRGFTIVELLVVIVVIGLLATIVTVAYNGISNRAKLSTLESDKTQAKKQIEAYYALNGSYPIANNCTNTLTTQICLKASPGNTLTYTFNGNTASPPYTLEGAVSGVATAPADPAVALLHGDGANLSTTIVDSSSVASNWTAVSGAKISTTQSKFGGSSLYLPNTVSDYVYPTAPASNFTFGTGDFTIETFFWTSGNGNYPWYSLFDWNGASGDKINLAYLGGGGPGFCYYVNQVCRIEVYPNAAYGTWHHVAVSRSGTSTRLFYNGVQQGATYTDNFNYGGATGYPRVGGGGFYSSSSPTLPQNMYLDEVRITKGVARYTSNFTPPTAAF